MLRSASLVPLVPPSGALDRTRLRSKRGAPRVCDRTVVPQYTLLYNVYQGKGEAYCDSSIPKVLDRSAPLGGTKGTEGFQFRGAAGLRPGLGVPLVAKAVGNPWSSLVEDWFPTTSNRSIFHNRSAKYLAPSWDPVRI